MDDGEPQRGMPLNEGAGEDEPRDEYDVVCPACACACDDLKVRTLGNSVAAVEPDCPLAESWFRDNSASDAPVATRAGRSVTVAEATTSAAELLAAARSPLVYGLSRSATGGQRAAVRLADRLRAVIDTTASLCHGPSILAMQNVGESTCSLGEVKNRCDLVVFWGCDPAETHPRHAERYSVFPRGLFAPEGRASRTVVMVGGGASSWKLNPSGDPVDRVIDLHPDRDFEALTTLRCLIQDVSVGQMRSGLGAELDDLRWLANQMKSCRSGVVFFGLGLTGTSTQFPTEDRLGHANVELLLRLTDELNQHTRFYARRMRLQGDVSGADSVLCWQTGFPFSVSLSRGYPRYNPGEYSANELLERDEIDACLLVGTETLPAFSEKALANLARIPTVALDYPGDNAPFEPTIRFTTAPYGLARRGTIYRMDETPLPLRALVTRDYPSDEEVLREILAQLPAS